MGVNGGGDGVTSPKGGPVFNANPETVSDLNKARKFTEKMGNHRTGTTNERDTATGNEVFDALMWGDTTDGCTYEYRNGGFRYFGGGNDLRTFGAWNGAARSQNPIIVNGQAAAKTSGTGVQIEKFKKPFPNGCFFVMLQPHQNTGHLSSAPPVLVEGTITKEGFQAFYGGRADTQVFLPYIAFGY
jgi:hypothetical protein